MRKMLLFISVVFVGHAKSQICFANPNMYSTGLSPTALVVADFNNDGRKDIAVANSGSNNIYIRLGSGSGTFPNVDSFNTGVGPQALLSSDFNEDGVIDLATANYGSIVGDISILLGTGNGTFGSATNFFSGYGPASITSGDFNRDGHNDVAVGNWGSSGSSFVSVLFGTGTGTFGSPTSYTIGSGSGSGYAKPSWIITDDFDNDSNLDLVTANSNDNSISLLIGTGTGTFHNMSNFSVGISPYSICSEDFDLDGKKDVAVANGVSTGISVLFGTGAGSFGSATGYTLGTSHCSSIIPLDYNNDGYKDLGISFGTYPGRIGVLQGNSLGVFSSPVIDTIASSAYTGPIIAGDFNNDSKIDLALLLYWSNQLAVILNCSTVSIDLIRKSTEAKIYPNPITDNILNVEAPSHKGRLRITDEVGREIFNMKFSEQKKLDISSWGRGFYLLFIETEQSLITEKIIIRE